MSDLSRTVFDFTATLVVIALGAGVVQGAREGKPFASAASINFFLDIFNRTKGGVEMATGETKPDGRPITQLATDAIREVEDDVAPIRESVCQLPRYETDRRDKIPIRLKDKAKGVKSIWQLQGVWGSPHCITRDDWIFIFKDDSRAIVTQKENILRVTFL
jgi:hypothetical protein